MPLRDEHLNVLVDEFAASVAGEFAQEFIDEMHDASVVKERRAVGQRLEQIEGGEWLIFENAHGAHFRAFR